MEKKIEIPYKTFLLSDLSEEDILLTNEAADAMKLAYAPYSKFQVGAAARTASGRILKGSNQESEVFPSTICAERSMLYHYQARHANDPIEAIAVVSSGNAECYPCGLCRQVMADTEKRQDRPIRVIMCGKSSATVIESVKVLLPFTFSL